MVFVRLGLAGSLTCGSVHPGSNPSTEPAPVGERSTLRLTGLRRGSRCRRLGDAAPAVEPDDLAAVSHRADAQKRTGSPGPSVLPFLDAGSLKTGNAHHLNGPEAAISYQNPPFKLMLLPVDWPGAESPT
jgi:hypothetical protein